jgi:signal transduction histidine kinase
VALLVQPLRSRLRRLADRLVYGRRATPYEVLTTFSGQVGDAVSVDELPARLAEAATRGLGARSATVRVLLPDGEERSAQWPPGSHAAGGGVPVPVVHAGEHIGDIVLDLPADGRPSAEQAELLATVAGQVGLALRNVQLTAELQRQVRAVAAQNEALVLSRKRMVSAQTAERQRFERRLSAAVRPHLRVVAVGLEQLEASVADREEAARRCEELAEAATSALDTLRDIARGLFPPILAERGLGAALVVATPATADVRVEVPPDLPRLPPVIEAAAYFCCADLFAAAAQASVPLTCRVTLEDDVLRIRVDSAGATAVAAASEDRVAAAGGRLVPRAGDPACVEITFPAVGAASRVLSAAVAG